MDDRSARPGNALPTLGAARGAWPWQLHPVRWRQDSRRTRRPGE